MSLRRIALVITVAACPMAALAQSYSFDMPRADSPPPAALPDDEDRPTPPIDTLLQDLFRRAQPHLEGLAREMQGTVQDLTPAFKELAGLVDDIGNYHAPERLPNGDILIRRRADAPPPPPLDELPNLMPRQQPAPPEAPPVPVDPAQPQIDL